MPGRIAVRVQCGSGSRVAENQENLGVVRPEFYDEYNRIENTHWWFLGRRRIFLQLLSRHLPLRETALILASFQN